MSIEVRGLKKPCATVVCDDLTWTSPTASWWRCWGFRAWARRRLRIIAGPRGARRRPRVLPRRGRHLHRRARDRNVFSGSSTYALSAHLSIFENVASWGCGRAGPARLVPTRSSDAVITKKVTELLELVQLAPQVRCFPHHFRRPAPARGAGARWRWSRARCCWTNPGALTRRYQGTALLVCAACTTRCTSPASSSPTTSRKRWKWPTASC